MITWSRTRTFLTGITLILATNAVALVGVAYNRSGAPESTMTLTQRELVRPTSWGSKRENSGLALQLQWRVLGEEAVSHAGIVDTPAWLDKAKLASLGFDVSKPVDTPEGRSHYDKLLPRDVLLVLELDGPAYQAALERARQHLQKEEALLAAHVGETEFEQRVDYAREQLDQEKNLNSRLFVVDAGLDAAALRAKYPDRTKYALVRGQVQVQIIRRTNHSQLAGYVDGIDVREINVPLMYRPIFEAMPKAAVQHVVHPPLGNAQAREYQKLPHYEVSVAFGKRLEPWITGASVPPQS